MRRVRQEETVKPKPKISIVTGKPSQRGKRLRTVDGLTWKQRNRDAVNARRRHLYAKNPENVLDHNRRYVAKNRKKVYAANRVWQGAYRASLRVEMIQAYGSQCNCCKEQEHTFLQLDHVQNDGHIDRKKHQTSTKLFAHLKRQGWPKDRYQLLCANCNFGKLMNGGICPHAKGL